MIGTRPQEKMSHGLLFRFVLVASFLSCLVQSFLSSPTITLHKGVVSRHPTTTTTTSGVVVLLAEKIFSSNIYDTIENGKIAVVQDFLPKDEIRSLQIDATSLHSQGFFSTDALASYGSSGKFDPTKDRAVLKLQQWKNQDLGEWSTRQRFANRMSALRNDLAYNLDRPGLLQGDSISQYGQGSTEISYTRFGPGAFLKRHVDEHHEELKGPDGWSKPTRRSLSWLIYLNENWNADREGGCLRCFERASLSSNRVGARSNGDLQIGWLRASREDPIERPVFMDAQHGGGGGGGGARSSSSISAEKKAGNCAMYIDSSSSSTKRLYITNHFNAHPTLFVAGGELLTQKLLVTRRDFAARFHFIEPPKFLVTDFLQSTQKKAAANDDESALDVEPQGGTLVVFDSVTLPHDVLATIGRERWATSGWMHEDQQAIETHPHYRSS
jgi:Rps23 Pro-64 3,4-dihydroxylase Tpa1-like proline 4-hydroxylase